MFYIVNSSYLIIAVKIIVFVAAQSRRRAARLKMSSTKARNKYYNVSAANGHNTFKKTKGRQTEKEEDAWDADIPIPSKYLLIA